ncbi:hypothetical protein FRB96_006530 [Tulasnella sp. 330]|nr:hypothetical protein FRB96_006530 [Tulasnella sp. 330]
MTGKVRVVEAHDGRELGFIARTVSGPLSINIKEALLIQLDPLMLATNQGPQRIKLLNALPSSPEYDYLGLMQRPNEDGSRSWYFDPCLKGGSGSIYRGRATSRSGGPNALGASKIWTLRAISARDPGRELSMSWPEGDGQRSAVYTTYTLEGNRRYLTQRASGEPKLARLVFEPLLK